VVYGKKENFERKKRKKKEIEKKRSLKSQSENRPNMLFIPRVLTTYYLLYLFIYYFIKINSILSPNK